MSVSEDSTVTYTTVSSLYEGRSGDVSPGVDGPPVMPKDPYAYVVATFQALPLPDYVPGPEEPEQAPPLPVYIPYVSEPVYPEYIPPEDDVFLAEEQPLPAATSPTAESPGYIPEADRSEVTLPPRKRLSIVHCARYEAGESSAAAVARPIEGRRADYGFVDFVEADIRRRRTKDIGYDDSQYHYETDRLVDQEARCSREAWAHFIGLSSVVHFELQRYVTHTWVQDQRIDAQDTLIATLTTQLSSLQGHLATALGEIRALQAREQARAGIVFSCNLKKMEPKKVASKQTTRLNPARDANQTGDDSHTSGTGVRRTERALTWWNSHVRIVGNDVAYVMTWIELKKKMADKYCSRNEIKKIKTEFWNLEVQGT
nr:putative reverse transcriptase domain-containing protein [Tanacetum cinerariifolium]